MALALLTIAGSLYFSSFKSASVRQVSPGNNKDYRLVVFGISIPYTPVTGKAFSRFYSPLLNYYASKQPKKEVCGAIRDIDLSKSELSISTAPGEGILIQIPSSMTHALGSFSEGESVRVTYSLSPSRDNPFCYFFQLSTIARSTK